MAVRRRLLVRLFVVTGLLVCALPAYWVGDWWGWFGDRNPWVGVAAGVLGVCGWVAITRIEKKLKRLERGLCVECGYDLRATPERCPECGAVTDRVDRA